MVTGVTNPGPFTVTGSFQLYTIDTTDSQLRDVNWHFGTIALYSTVTEFPQAYAKWVQTVVDTGDNNEYEYDTYDGYFEGRWNNPGNRTLIDFGMKLSRGLRPHDQFQIGITGFGLQYVSQCWSIFLGDGIFEKWETGWKENKVIGAYSMEQIEPQY